MAETVIQKKRFQAVNLLMGAVKNLRFYPPSSDIVKGSLDRAYASLVDTLEQAGPVIFSISGDQLTISGCPLNEKERLFPQIRSMLESMSNWGIDSLAFEKDLTKDELIQFLLDFKKLPDDIQAEGGPAKLIAKLPALHIRVESNHLPKESAGAEPSSPGSPDARPNVSNISKDGSLPDLFRQEKRVRQALEALAGGEKSLFIDREFIALAPELILHWIHGGRRDDARAILGKTGDAAQTSDAVVRDAAAEILVETGNRLASEGRLDDLQVILVPLMNWVRSATVFSPSLKAACRQFELSAAHLIQNERWEECLPQLNTLHALSVSNDVDKDLSSFAVEMLASVAKSENLRILSDTMLNEPPPSSSQAAKCLNFLNPEATRWLLNLLAGTPDRSYRIRIMAAITEFGPAILPLILSDLEKGGSWYYLRNLVSMAGKLGNETHLDAMKPFLNHEDLRVKREALNTIYSIGGDRRKEILLSALPSADEQTKIPMVIMLGGLQDPETVPPLLKLLESRPLIPSSHRIRLEEAICKALARIGDLRAIPVLRAISETKGLMKASTYADSVKKAAVEAVVTIEKSPARPDKSGSAETRMDSATIQEAAAETDDFSSALGQVDVLVLKGDKARALTLIGDLIRNAVEEKQFQTAETLLEIMSAIDPMALSQIHSAGKWIEAGKTASMDKGRLNLWSPLYDRLTEVETHMLYLLFQEKNYGENVVLLQQGQKNESLYFIEEGELKVVFESENQENLVKHIQAGDVAGAESFFNATLNTLSVITQTLSRINILDMQSLNRSKNKTPALESKLRDFCMGKEDTWQILLEKSFDRRTCPRRPAERSMAIQLLDASGNIAGKVFKGRLTDLSSAGLSFFIKLQNKESARLLLGRKLQMQFPLFLKNPDELFRANGTVVAVHYNLSIDYSVHVRFDTTLDTATLDSID